MIFLRGGIVVAILLACTACGDGQWYEGTWVAGPVNSQLTPSSVRNIQSLRITNHGGRGGAVAVVDGVSCSTSLNFEVHGDTLVALFQQATPSIPSCVGWAEKIVRVTDNRATTAWLGVVAELRKD